MKDKRKSNIKKRGDLTKEAHPDLSLAIQV